MHRKRDRMLIAMVVVVWTIALVLGGTYLVSAREAAGPVTSSRVSQGSTGPSPVSGTSPQPTAPPTTAAHTAAAPTTAPPTTTLRKTLTIAAGGDVIGDRDVGTFIDTNGGDAVLAGVAPRLRGSQVAFVNLESPLSNKGARNVAKDVTFRGRTALVQGLHTAGIDVVSLANNHALDWGPKALLDTVARLDAAGIAHAGAGGDLDAARAPALLRTTSGTVAVLAYTLILPEGFAAGTDRAGVNPGRAHRERLLADIAAASKRADWVVVSFHWGVEYTGQASREQRALAHDAVDAGADLILGHHPHVLQGLELYRNRLIAYSLGDFVFDHYSRPTGETVVLEIEMSPAGPPSFRVTPVYLSESHGIPRVVAGTEARAILRRLSGFSADLGVPLTITGDRAVFSAP
jgi:poly-gamma-glutamate synthesis protein (capsule biosynthesis protein)